MTDHIKNGTVKWKVFVLALTMGAAILGVIWNEVRNVGVDLVEVKLEVVEIKTNFNNLVRRIDGGEITFRVNGR